MQVEIKVPVMGESVSEAIVSAFLVPSGSYVSSGQEVMELETDKVNQVLYAPESGEVVFLVSLADVVKVGQKIGSIETDVKDQVPKETTEKKKTGQSVEVVSLPLPTKPEGGARKGPEDFIRSLEAKPVEEKKVFTIPAIKVVGSTRKKMSGLRKTIASKLVEVKNKTAMLTTFNEIDMTAVMEIRAKEKEAFQKKYGVKLGFMSFFTKAAVAALKTYPIINSSIEGDEIVTFQSYDIGVAVSTEKGLFVPVLKGAENKSFGDIEMEIASQAKRAREGSISIDDLRGGTFTITNGGTFGSLLSTPILNSPESAILGMHAIVKRAVVVEDQIVIRPMMYVALSYDHRIIDGKEAVLFLVHIKESLEDPSKILLEL